MYDSLKGEKTLVGSFSTRRLMKMTGLSSYSSIRRACFGLVKKLSIESVIEGGSGTSLYRVFEPKEIFERRLASGVSPYPEEVLGLEKSHIFGLIAENVMQHRNLSRREALVALLCAEGMSNAAIGQKLSIDEDTVKFHLRNVYIKLGVKRRTELIGYLLSAEHASKNGADKSRS
jgi:DNA-binding CsgD family transcriptional regulator